MSPNRRGVFQKNRPKLIPKEGSTGGGMIYHIRGSSRTLGAQNGAYCAICIYGGAFLRQSLEFITGIWVIFGERSILKYREFQMFQETVFIYRYCESRFALPTSKYFECATRAARDIQSLFPRTSCILEQIRRPIRKRVIRDVRFQPLECASLQN